MYVLKHNEGKTSLKLVVPKIEWVWVESQPCGYYLYEKDHCSGYTISEESNEIRLISYSIERGYESDKVLGCYQTLQEAMLEAEILLEYYT